MSCYFVAQIRIHDAAEYDRYLERVDEVFAGFRGEYLAVDDAPEVVEGSWPFVRLVLIRFPDEAEFRRWYHSPQYQDILRHRMAGAASTALLVHEGEAV